MAVRKPKKDWNEDLTAAVARLSRGKSKFLRIWAVPEAQEKLNPVVPRKPTHIRHSSALELMALRPATKQGHRRIPSMPVLDPGRTKAGDWHGKGLTERKSTHSKPTSRQTLVRFERLPLMNPRGLKVTSSVIDLFPLPPYTDLCSPLPTPDLQLPPRAQPRPLEARAAMLSPIGRLELSCNCDQTLELLYDTLRSVTK